MVRHLLTGLHTRYDRGIVEQAAIAGALAPIDDAPDAESIATAEAAATTLAARLDARADDMERGWHGRIEHAGYVMTRELRGVTQAAILDAGLLASAEARRLSEHTAALAEIYSGRRAWCERARIGRCRARASCSMPSWRPAARASRRCSATKALAR